MTWTVWPENASAGSPSYSAQVLRQTEGVWHTPHPSGLSRPLGALSGRRPFSWNVTVSGSAVTVAPGAGVLDVESPVATGAYRVASDANDTSLTLNAAPSNPNSRIDGIYIQVDDTDVDGSGFRKALPAYVAGTPGTSPTAPSTGLPANSIRIATVLVPFSGSAVVTMDSNFVVAAGGVLPVLSSSFYPATPYVGQQVYDMTLLQRVEWNGTQWAGAWATYTPTWAGATVGSGSSVGRYRLDGKTMFLRAALNFGSGTSISSTLGFSLPSGFTAVNDGMEQDILVRTFVSGTTNLDGHAGIPANGSSFTVVMITPSTTSTVLNAIAATGGFTTGSFILAQGFLQVN